MRRGLVAIGALLLGVALLGGVFLYVGSSSDVSDFLRGDERGAQASERDGGRRSAREARADRAENSGFSEIEARLDSVTSAAARPARLALTWIGAGILFVLVTRTLARRTRRSVRLTLVPFRAEFTSPDDVRRLLEAWHQQLLERWWKRLLFGQRGMALEVTLARDAEDDSSATLTLVCPRKLAATFEGALLGCYPDSRVTRSDEPPPFLHRVIRLKKRHSFVRALRSLEDEREAHNVMDSLLSQMASLEGPSMVQYALVPTPGFFDRYSRARFASIERTSEHSRVLDPTNPGLRSHVLREELVGGLRVQHHPLFFGEIRVGAESYRACQAIAGRLRGESGAENRLVERFMRPWSRGPLYLSRLRRGVGNPLPGWRKGVYSSSEVASLWQLPSPGMKLVRFARSPIPRIPASPEVSRAAAHTLMRDERGSVGIRPEDKSDGLGLIGGQKTGKTSVLCRTVRADALDPDCALIVLMPKPGDAHKALSLVPPDRTVHYLDLERPEFGINPLVADGDPAMVADRIVDAFRDVNAEGDIRGSSDRYLRQAAQAAIGASTTGVVDGPPTLWHMYRILIPVERAFRERVVESLYLDPRFTDTATFFGRELPSDLEHAPGQTTAKLDAPRNKLLRLMVESLDMVLRHPRQLSLDEIVRRREVLIVDGKMGTFGADNCRVMMQFILNSLYGALQRQQQLPEEERVRVALKVDEAHLILNDSFADALATLRSGGLEVVAAWQYGAQIQDPKIRAGMMSLLRQRCMFSMGEEADAREISSIAMPVYSDMIRVDAEARSVMRVTPDTIFNLPNYHALCSWISRGARVPAFLAQTIPLESDDQVVRHHLEAQRERGGLVPDRLPDPLPDVDWKGLRDLPSEELFEDRPPIRVPTASANGHGGDGHGGVADDEAETVVARAVEFDFDPAATSIDSPNEVAVKPLPQTIPETIAELDLDDVRGLQWDKVTPVPADRRHDPSQRELEILAALWSYRFLFASQLWRRWWRGASLRAAQQGLTRMAKAGWVRRFKFQRAEGGSQQRVYCLTRLGFELAQQHTGRRGAYIDPEAKWREPVISDARRILRDLHVNGWVLAFEARAGRMLKAWRGPREGRLEPPRRRVRGEWKDIAPEDVVVGANHKLRDYGWHRFDPVSPDASLELRIPAGESSLTFDLLVELDRARAAAASEDRLRRYDGLISAWAGMLDRYKVLGTPPMVIFICEDERSMMNLVGIADRTVTARLAKPGVEESEWPHPGRRGMFFAVERELHTESLRAVQLPDFPPDMRVRLHGRKAKALHPKRVNFIEPKLIDLA